MCIPCTMCGACLERMGDLPPNVCPSCGAEVPPEALVCPSCYTLVPRRRDPAPADAATESESAAEGRR